MIRVTQIPDQLVPLGKRVAAGAIHFTITRGCISVVQKLTSIDYGLWLGVVQGMRRNDAIIRQVNNLNLVCESS